MKPVFLCNPKKCKKCPKTSCGYWWARKEESHHYADNRVVETLYYCFCTTKFWQADWKKMFKFWWNKWFGNDRLHRCRHLCCFCEFRKEYYVDCMVDLSDAATFKIKSSALKKPRTVFKHKPESDVDIEVIEQTVRDMKYWYAQDKLTKEILAKVSGKWPTGSCAHIPVKDLVRAIIWDKEEPNNEGTTKD